jgi:RNA polymerase-binding protein DksA
MAKRNSKLVLFMKDLEQTVTSGPEFAKYRRVVQLDSGVGQYYIFAPFSLTVRNQGFTFAAPMDGRPQVMGIQSIGRGWYMKLTAAERRKYKKLLLEKRAEITGDVTNMESHALRYTEQDNSVDHMADFGTDNFEQQMTLGLIENNEKLLQEIDAALERIENGTYGFCVYSGEPISKARLDAIPWTPYSIETQRKVEEEGLDLQNEDEG